MDPQLRNYITSERFIHDGLVRDATALMKKLYEYWKRDKKIESSAILWAASAVPTDDGEAVEIVAMSLEGIPSHKEALRAAVDRVRAYAFLYVRQEERAVKALLESPHGTRSWVIPINRSADVDVLGRAKHADDKDYLGLLWVPRKSRA